MNVTGTILESEWLQGPRAANDGRITVQQLEPAGSNFHPTFSYLFNVHISIKFLAG